MKKRIRQERDVWSVEVSPFYLQNSFLKRILDSIFSQTEELYALQSVKIFQKVEVSTLHF